MRRDRPDPSSPVGQLLTALQSLRKGDGISRVKVARLPQLCRLPVVQVEAARTNLPPEEIAYRLVTVATYQLKSQRMRGFAVNALALGYMPTGKDLSDRRRRYAADLDESRVRDHEDEALEELARLLLVMDDPQVSLGDYTHEFYAPPLTEWDVGIQGVVTPIDALHPRTETAWDHLEITTRLDENGVPISQETRGLIRARFDGVTGYTVHITTDTGTQPKGIFVIAGGRTGRKHPHHAGGPYSLNFDFTEPLPRNVSDFVHWIVELEPMEEPRPLLAYAHHVESPTRDLTLRVQFHGNCLPITPKSFESNAAIYPQRTVPPRSLRRGPGNIVAMSWRSPDQAIFGISWSFDSVE